jgi:hypothetical protein
MQEPKTPATSSSYLLPVEDSQFLLRDEMRGIRFALEYAKAELALRDWGVRSTIIVFGGGRVPSPEAAAAAARAAQLPADTQKAEHMKRRPNTIKLRESSGALPRSKAEPWGQCIGGVTT